MFGVIRGALYPLRGLFMILRDGRLLMLSLLPVACSLLLYLGLGWLLWNSSAAWYDRWLPAPVEGAGAAGVLEVFRHALYWLGLALIAFGAILGFVLVIRIVGAPFFEAMSQRTERLMGLTGEDWLPGSLLQDILAEVSIAFWRVFIWVALLPLHVFLPGIGSVLHLSVTFYFLAMEFLAAPMARRGWKLRIKIGFLLRSPGRVLGFTACSILAFLIPFAAAFVIPCCVVGGTLLFIESQPRPQLRA